jgi:hypothetical protein
MLKTSVIWGTMPTACGYLHSVKRIGSTGELETDAKWDVWNSEDVHIYGDKIAE